MSNLLYAQDFTPKKGYGVIYMYVFDNGRKYIGKTTYSVSSRYKNHLRADNVVDRALKTHKHIILLVDYAPEDQLAEKEINYIQKYETIYPKGYNMTEGGEGCRCLESVRNFLSESRKGIGNPMFGKKPPQNAKNARHAAKCRQVPVMCITTGKKYKSITEASLDTNIPQPCIYRVCNRERYSTHKTEWCFIDDPVLFEFNKLARSVSTSILLKKL